MTVPLKVAQLDIFFSKYCITSFCQLCSSVILCIMTEVLSYRNQSIDLLCESMDWGLYYRSLRHERVKVEWVVFANFKDLACHQTIVTTGISLVNSIFTKF